MKGFSGFRDGSATASSEMEVGVFAFASAEEVLAAMVVEAVVDCDRAGGG